MSNKSYRSEKNIADKGWKAMEEILDREMPVERKRRRAFVILYRLAAVLLPLLAALAWFVSETGPDGRVVSPAGQPVAEQTAGKNAQPATGIRKPGESRLETPAPAEIAALDTPEARENTPAKPVANSAAQKSGVSSGAGAKQPATMASKEETPTTPKKNSKKGKASQAIVDGAIAPALHASLEQQPAGAPAETTQPGTPDVMPAERTALAATVPDPTQTPTQQPAISAAEPAPVAAPASADTLVQTALALAPPIEPIREKSLHWGATTGALSDNSARFGGATAGLTLDWKVGEKWGIRSGLAYQYHTLQEDNQPLTTVTTATYAEATGDQTIFDNGGFVTTAVDLTAPVYVAVSRLHRVEMPLLAYWQPFSKVRLFGGASLGATAFAEVNDQSFKGFKVYDIKAGTPERNLNSRVSEQVRSLDVRWSVGASFRATRSIELGLFFQSPIRALSDTGWLEADSGATTPSNINPDIEKLAMERRDVANSRGLFQLLATVFF